MIFNIESRLPRRFWIGRRLWISAACAVLLFTTVAGFILAHAFFQTFLRARYDVAGVERFRLVLETANRISAERAPSNMLMGHDTALLRDRLQAARAQTDRALMEETGVVPAGQLQETERKLRRARELVDRAAGQSMPRRESLQQAIDAELATYDAYRAVIMAEAASLIRTDSGLAAPVQYALILCILRDDGGRLGSVVVPALITREAISEREMAASDQLAGRMAIQWQLLDLGANLADLGPGLSALRAEAEGVFFRDGQPLVARLIREGTHAEPYTESVESLSERYSRMLGPLENWRNGFLDGLLAHYRQRERQACELLWVVSAVMLVVIGLIAGMVLLVHLRVLRPLLQASEAVVGLVHDQPVMLPFRHRGGRELQPLFEALGILRDKLQERAAQARHLKHLAETDELTQLLNRRAFQMLAEPIMEAGAPGGEAFLILLDIDHFKAINDRYGHGEGDRVLVAVAAALRAQVRPGDLVARVGGEEFAVLIRTRDQGDALSLAHRLHQAVGDLEIRHAGDGRIAVTASFGLAAGKDLTWRQFMAKADVALYAAKRAGRNTIRVAGADSAVGPDHAV